MTSPHTTVGVARRALAARFRAAGIDNPELDARLLAGATTGLDLTQLVVETERVLTAKETATLDVFAARRIAGEPIARILGEQEFWGLRLTLAPSTLIPRPDTETVVEAALECARAMQVDGSRYRIADLGTGSGAILLALLTELPNAVGVGTDLSRETLAIAQSNATRHGLADRATFVASDFAAALEGPFDLVVSNPPYIRSADIASLAIEVRAHDPRLALDGGADGLDAYRTITRQAAGILTPGGALVVEIGIGQDSDVKGLMVAAGLIPAGPGRSDLTGIVRAVTARKPGA